MQSFFMDKSAIRSHVERLWDESIVGELVEYIRIPNKSVAFDRDWKAHGHMDRVVARFLAMQAKGELLTGRHIRDIVTVNGVRVTVEDGTWGLVRASSNKPELVVVVESPVSEARMREMFAAVDGVLRENSEVGAYNQTI